MRQTKMTKKENYNRYRCKTLVFTQSNVEKERINNLVYLSGMSKQDYIIRRLLNEEVVAIPNIKVQKHIREMLQISREMVSLDAPVEGKDGDTGSVGDFISDENYSNVDEKIMEESLKKDMDEMLGTLKPNEEKVLRLRYGIGGSKPMSLSQVGECCNLTKERIRQIEKTAISRMQHPVRSKKLYSYVVA